MMGAALAEGLVTRDHLDIAVATLRRSPRSLKKKVIEDGGVDADGVAVAATGAEVIDRALTEDALTAQPSSVQRLGRQIVHRLDPDRTDRFNADAYERSTCSISKDFAGMTMLRLITDPANGLLIRSAIARFSAPRPAGTAIGEDGETVVVRDTRTAGQRQAEAAVELLLTGAGLKRITPDTTSAGIAEAETDDPPQEQDAPEQETPRSRPPSRAPTEQEPQSRSRPSRCGRPPPHRSATPSNSSSSPPSTNSSPATGPSGNRSRQGRTGPDVTGRTGRHLPRHHHRPRPPGPLRLRQPAPTESSPTTTDESSTSADRRRFAIPAQRQALAVRDGGCCAPGCHAPPEWSEAHHVIPWEHGGRTDIDNLVLLCRTHHTAHHAGVYDLDLRNGIPWVRVPAWVDPERPWLRNTTHQHHTTADTIAATLLEPPATGDAAA